MDGSIGAALLVRLSVAHYASYLTRRTRGPYQCKPHAPNLCVGAASGDARGLDAEAETPRRLQRAQLGVARSKGQPETVRDGGLGGVLEVVTLHLHGLEQLFPRFDQLIDEIPYILLLFFLFRVVAQVVRAEEAGIQEKVLLRVLEGVNLHGSLRHEGEAEQQVRLGLGDSNREHSHTPFHGCDVKDLRKELVG